MELEHLQRVKTCCLHFTCHANNTTTAEVKKLILFLALTLPCCNPEREKPTNFGTTIFIGCLSCPSYLFEMVQTTATIQVGSKEVPV